VRNGCKKIRKEEVATTIKALHPELNKKFWRGAAADLRGHYPWSEGL